MIYRSRYFIFLFLLICSCNSRAQRIESCNQYYIQNKFDECFQCTKELLKTSPNDLDAMILSSKCAQTKEQMEEIESLLKGKFVQWKDEITYWITLGDLYIKMELYSIASVMYKKSQDMNPAYGGINYKLAKSNYLQAMVKPARNIVTIDSKKEEAELLKTALVFIEKELSNTPDDSSSLFLNLDILVNLGEDDVANSLISILEKKHPNEYLYYKKGLVKMGLKEYQSAIEAYDKAISINPNNFIYYSNRGNSYRAQNKFKEALENYRKALSFNRKNKGLYISILDLAYKMNDQELFCEFYQEYKTHVENQNFINFKAKYKDYQKSCG